MSVYINWDPRAEEEGLSASPAPKVRGVKFDAGKPQPRLILESMSRALMAVSEVGTFGARKYSPDGWKSVPDAISRYKDAKHRHMLLSCTEDFDEESGLLHVAHEAWNALALLELVLEERDAR